MPTCVICKEFVREVFVFHDETRLCALCIKAGRIDEAVTGTESTSEASMQAEDAEAT
jgi:hypothetical protein